MTASRSASKPFAFRYLSCRNISAPEDEASNRKVYAGHCPASSVLELEDDANVREYLVNAPGKGRASPTLVHQAIRKTLNDRIDQFSILNGGMVLVARDAEVDDKNKVITLKNPSIINGSQTQGELRRYFEQNGSDAADPSIKFELIVTSDSDLIAEISIARNFQNDVRAISIAGRRGQLDELETAVQRVHKDVRLRKSETDVDADEYLDTEKLIQVLFAMMPDDVFVALNVSDSKVFTYSQKARCLKTFQRVVDSKKDDAAMAAAYAYCLDMAGFVWTAYERWKTHAGFKGTRLRSIEREDGEIRDVPDGIVFPILAALSVFIRKKGSHWTYATPRHLDEAELIDTAATLYKEVADSQPWIMGKSKGCYSTLHRVTSIYAKLA